MNTYITTKGHKNPLLFLESVDAIPSDIQSKHSETLLNEIAKLNEVILTSEDEVEIMMAKTRSHTVVMGLRMNVNVDYAAAIEKYGAIGVNDRGGYCDISPKDIVKRWEAETAEGAIC